MRYSPALAVLILTAAIAAQGEERALLDRTNRFLDRPYPKSELLPAVVMADSFEDWQQTRKDWKFDRVTAEISTEHATDGRQSLKVTFPDSAAALRYCRGTRGWGMTIPGSEEILGLRALHYDALRLEVFNPGDPVRLVGTAAVDARWKCELKAGSNSLVIPTAELRKEVYRVNDIPGSLAFSLAGISRPHTLFLDAVRWTGPGLGKNLVRYAKCLQFGEAQAFLQDLRAQIQPEADHYFQSVGDNQGWGGWDNTWTQKATAWKGPDYDRHRRQLVRHIAALVAAR